MIIEGKRVIEGKAGNSSIVLILCLVLSLLIISNVYAESEKFNVFDEIVRTVELAEEEKVSGSITVTGLGIDFYVTDTNGDTILRYDKAVETSFTFTASTAGTYTMHFSNETPMPYQTVRLNYSVSHPTSGIPQETFYFLVIVIAVVIVIIVLFVTLSKRKRTPPSETK